MTENIEIEQLTEFALSTVFRSLSDRQSVFCPFDALKVTSAEIRHSNFLANVLDPLAPHGFGETVLRCLIDRLLATSGDHGLRLELELTDIGQVEVYREFRNMDLVIHLPDHSPKLLFVIELKTGSGEHGDQLQRYQTAAEELWPDSKRRFFLVSPTGTEASSDIWTSMGFEEIALALENSLTSSSGGPLARDLLQSYVSMLRRMFVPDEDMERLARKLWQKHGLTLEYLISQRPSLMRDASIAVQSPQMLNGIFEAIKERTGITLLQDSSSNTYLRCYVPAWGDQPDITSGDFTKSKHVLILEVEFYGERVHARWIIGRGEQTSRRAFYDRLCDGKAVDTGNNKKLTGQWTRLASQTIKRVKNIDDATEEDLEKLIDSSRKGLVEFASKHLQSYDKAVRSSPP